MNSIDQVPEARPMHSAHRVALRREMETTVSTSLLQRRCTSTTKR